MTMTDTEAKAHQLEMECAKDMGITSRAIRRDTFSTHEALCRAIEREAATEARHAAELRELKERFGETALFLDSVLQARAFSKSGPARSRLAPFILPAPDPLVEEEDPIDALVDLLAPILTHSQGMAARERESRFRNALAALKARGV